jgi:hypothetical protein
VVNVGQVNHNRVMRAAFGNVFKGTVNKVAVGFDKAEAKAALGILLHEVFEQRALTRAALAEDIDTVCAVGFRQSNRTAEVNGRVCLRPKVEHSGE